MATATATAAHFAVPNLVFNNRTPLDAVQFDMVDLTGSAFHVFVAKAAYAMGAHDADGLVTLTTVLTAKLNVEDHYFDDDPQGSVREESDFAPYKPACDVIVNATAYMPRGPSAPGFQVRLIVHDAQQAIVIDKLLGISGAQNFQRKAAPWLGKLVNSNPWRLGPASTATNLPVRYAYAIGGQCRLVEGDAARHESCDANPCGRGFVRRWYLDATRIMAFAAPQIHVRGAPLTAEQFWQGANGAALPAPVGLGSVGRGWAPRRALAGTFEDKAVWDKDEVPRLPMDFDFAWYNSAPRDQQCPHLSGQEKFTLYNLCSADHPSALVDAKGHTVLRFLLPRDQLFIVATDGNNKAWIERMVIDTVTIAPEERRVDLVWRMHLAADVDFRVARLTQLVEAAQIARLDELLRAQAVLGEGAVDDQ